MSGNPHLSTKETLHLNLGDNNPFLIGCDEERIAHGIYVLDKVFRRCITHFIKDITQDNNDKTDVPTGAPLCLHLGPTTLSTSSNIRPAVLADPNNSILTIVPTIHLHQAPTIPPTSTNIQPVTPTCSINSLHCYPRAFRLHQAPTVLPTNSNGQLVTPTRPDRSVPTPVPTFRLHQNSAKPSTNSDIKPITSACLKGSVPANAQTLHHHLAPTPLETNIQISYFHLLPLGSAIPDTFSLNTNNIPSKHQLLKPQLQIPNHEPLRRQQLSSQLPEVMPPKQCSPKSPTIKSTTLWYYLRYNLTMFQR